MSLNNLATVLTVMDTTLRLLERQDEIRANYKKVRDKIKDMVTEGRDPTPEEWAELEAKLTASNTLLDTRADEARELLADDE